MLKWLQKLSLLNNVRLLHSEDASHNCVHTSRLGTLPGELGKYFSVLRLHAWPEPNLLATVVGGALVPLAAAVVREGFLPEPEPDGFSPEPEPDGFSPEPEPEEKMNEKTTTTKREKKKKRKNRKRKNRKRKKKRKGERGGVSACAESLGITAFGCARERGRERERERVCVCVVLQNYLHRLRNSCMC